MVYNLKDNVKGYSAFQYCRDGSLWYMTQENLLFPVPLSDTDGATFLAKEKSIFFMRWIRKYLDELTKHGRDSIKKSYRAEGINYVD